MYFARQSWSSVRPGGTVPALPGKGSARQETRALLGPPPHVGQLGDALGTSQAK